MLFAPPPLPPSTSPCRWLCVAMLAIVLAWLVGCSSEAVIPPGSILITSEDIVVQDPIMEDPASGKPVVVRGRFRVPKHSVVGPLTPQEQADLSALVPVPPGDR